jgi:hypothetical protein
MPRSRVFSDREPGWTAAALIGMTDAAESVFAPLDHSGREWNRAGGRCGQYP